MGGADIMANMMAYQVSGLEIAKNTEKTIMKTYHKGMDSLKKSINAFKTLGHSNLLHRKMLFQSIINSKLTHIYRVLIPPPPT